MAAKNETRNNTKYNCCHGLCMCVGVSFQFLSTHLYYVEIYTVRLCATFLPPLLKWKDNNCSPSIALAYNLIPFCSSCQIWLVMIYTYQTCPLVELFFKDKYLNECNTSVAKSWVEDCLELISSMLIIKL